MEFNIGDRVKTTVDMGSMEEGIIGAVEACDSLYSMVRFDKMTGLYSITNKNIELIQNDLKNHTHSSVAPNKYKRKISGIHVHVDARSGIATIEIDIYDVLKAWSVTNPATQHAIKKLLQPGERGHKDKLTDLREAGKSIDRAIELES